MAILAAVIVPFSDSSLRSNFASFDIGPVAASFILAGLLLGLSVGGTQLLRLDQERKLRKTPMFSTSTTIKISETAFQSNDGGGSSSVFWPQILEVAEEKEHIFFFIAPNQAFIVPKRAFDSPDAAHTFAERAKQFRAAHQPAIVPIAEP